MPAKTSAFDNAFLQLIFNGTTISVENNSGSGTANLATDVGAVPNLYVSLHTANPGTNGNQNTNEAQYSNYNRVAVARTTGWVVTGSSVSPAATISFPIATGGSESETYFGIGTSTTGAGTLLYFGSISPSITVSTGITPQLTTSSSITEA